MVFIQLFVGPVSDLCVQPGYLHVPQREEESELDIDVFFTPIHPAHLDGLDGYRKKKTKSEIAQFHRLLKTDSQTYLSGDCGRSIDENAVDAEHKLWFNAGSAFES